MSISLNPSSNPILCLYSLFDQPGVVPQDDPYYLGLTISCVSDFGHERARELVEFLSRTAVPALRSCRLTLSGQPVVNFAAHSATDLFDWPLIEDLAQQGALSEDCLTALLEWQQLLEQYEIDGYWGGDGDPITACPAVLDDLKGCDMAGQSFVLEISLDKESLAEQHLLGGLPWLQEKVSALVWHDLESMCQAFGDFHRFLKYLAQAASRPVLLFFHAPIEPYPGDFFKVLSLDTTAVQPGTLAGRPSSPGQRDRARASLLRVRRVCFAWRHP